MNDYEKKMPIDKAEKVMEMLAKTNIGLTYWIDGKTYRANDALETIMAEHKELKNEWTHK